MNSKYASKQLKEEIWPDFIAHFQSDATIASYHTDICELMNLYEKDFLEIRSSDIKDYHEKMRSKVKANQLQYSTMAKKFRELHSFASYIIEESHRYKVPLMFQDYFYPYLPLLEKQKKYARSIPITHIDQILVAAQSDFMVYTILVLLHRVGLSSTEIIQLRQEDLSIYDNGAYVQAGNRKNLTFIPEDAFQILVKYMEEYGIVSGYLFCNRLGKPLNTMYISRMMKKYTGLAGVPSYSAEALRNSCAFTMFAYEATPEQVAAQLGVSTLHIKRYKNVTYRDELSKAGNNLVKIQVAPPDL